MLSWLKSFLVKILVILALVIAVVAIIYSAGVLPSVIGSMAVFEGFTLANWLWVSVALMTVAAVADPEAFTETIGSIVDGATGLVTKTGRAFIGILPPWMWACIIGTAGYVAYRYLNQDHQSGVTIEGEVVS